MAIVVGAVSFAHSPRMPTLETAINLCAALPFGLLERILYSRDPSRIIQESSRLELLNDMLTQVGVEKEVYADFVDPTFTLMQDLARLLSEDKFSDAESKLLQAFNDPEIGNAIIMHFRVCQQLCLLAGSNSGQLIASAYLKINADLYAPFLDDAPDIPTYCAQHIDPFAAEIEQLGLQALSAAVFEPAGIAYEILYLDRSSGGEVTQHNAGVEGQAAKDVGKVRLLYRP